MAGSAISSEAHPAARLRDLPGVIYACAFPRWKWRFVRRCFIGHTVRFLPAGAKLPTDGALLLWGMAQPPKGLGGNVPVIRMEDGFLRSVGLGAELTRPLSWVADRRGIYYDATRESELEFLLERGHFGPDLLARAAALRERVLAAGLTKYNLDGRPWRRPSAGRHVVLVPGQVESDASLAFGAPGLRTNMALLRTVRQARPDSYLMYKPHPDVVARLRREGREDAQAVHWCDEIVTDVAMGELLNAVDEVQVMTSLAGFEALLRGKRVVCHGSPFYAGWGLTDDTLPHPRRTRRLGLDQLVAASLILYPLYIGTHTTVTPEQALDELQAWKARDEGRARPLQGVYRFFLRRFIGVR
jgi:capsular polysaccharide export protein